MIHDDTVLCLEIKVAPPNTSKLIIYMKCLSCGVKIAKMEFPRAYQAGALGDEKVLHEPHTFVDIWNTSHFTSRELPYFTTKTNEGHDAFAKMDPC